MDTAYVPFTAMTDPSAWHVQPGVLPSGEGYDLGTVVSMSHVSGHGWVAYTKRDDITGSVLERLNAWHVTGPWHVAAQQWQAEARARMRMDLLGPGPPGQPGSGRPDARVLGQQPRRPWHDMRHAAPVHLPAHRLTLTLQSWAAAASGGRGNEPERKASE